jgi:hypothetical protein
MLSYAKLLVDDAFYLISRLNSHVSFLCDHPRVASKDLPSLFHVFRGGYHLGSDSRTKFWIAWIVENTAPRWLAILGSSWSSILQRWPHRSATKRVSSLHLSRSWLVTMRGCAKSKWCGFVRSRQRGFSTVPPFGSSCASPLHLRL